MIVISNSLVLSEPTEPLDTPIFGWRNLVTAANVSATSEAEGYPASSVANPSTALRWVAAPGSPADDQYLTAAVQSVDELDYIAIAGHNLGSAQCAVSVEGASGLAGSPPEPDYVELVQETLLADDSPVLFRFAPQALTHIRLRIRPGNEAPRIAVMYAGKLLVAPRGTGVDHTPINLGRTANVVNATSENGQFLGRIVLSEMRQTGFSLQHLKQSWYRNNMDPFIKASRETPFFFAWRPLTFPRDVGYVWTTNDPQPQVSFDTGRIAIELSLSGVA